MRDVRTKWYEYCKNCSYRVKVRNVGGYTEITCNNCGKSEETDDPTIYYEVSGETETE